MTSPHRSISPLGLALVLSLVVLGAARPLPAGAQGLPCGAPPGPTPSAILAGMTAVTCFSGLNFQSNPVGFKTAPVVAIIDTRIPSPHTYQPQLGVNWCAPSFHGPSDSWNNANLGQVFGITIDGANPPNIYVAASTVYGSNVPSTTGFGWPFAGSPFGPGGSGAVYRLSGANGSISTWATLPNSGPALGNIDFDPVTSHFFVTNFEDGRIYNLVDSGGTATCVETFDHETGVITPGCAAEPGDAPGFPPLGAVPLVGGRPWGVQAHQGRLYYGLWVEDEARTNPTRSNEVWSIALTPGGLFSGAAVAEVTGIAPMSGATSSPISDLSFSSTGSMIIAERGMKDDIGAGMNGNFGAHAARNLEFVNSSGSWTPSSQVFGVGAYSSGKNAAGGNDVDCDNNLWSTGNAMLVGAVPSVWAYGMQRSPSTGNTGALATIVSTGYFVDFDGVAGGSVKGGLGDVVIHRACGPAPQPVGCLTLSKEQLYCESGVAGPTGCWVYKFTVTNTSTKPIVHLDIPSTNVSPNTFNFAPPLMPNASIALSVRICGVPFGSFNLTMLPIQLGSDPCCDPLVKGLVLPCCEDPCPTPPPVVAASAGAAASAAEEAASAAKRAKPSWLSRFVDWLRSLGPAARSVSASADQRAAAALRSAAAPRPVAAPTAPASAGRPLAPARPAACLPPPGGMVAWWPLDEPSGNVARDIVGGRVGSVRGGNDAIGPQSAGRVGIARTFDGINDAVSYPDDNALEPGNGDFTVDAWFRRVDRGGEHPIVSKLSGGRGFEIGLVGSGNLSFNYTTDAGSGGTSLVATASPNAWHFIAFTVQRAPEPQARVYLDGQSVGTFGLPAGALDTQGQFWIGGRQPQGPDSPGAFFMGQIDEVEVFRRALSAAEVLSIYNAGAEGKCKTSPVTPTPPANLTGAIQSERGCLETGQNPVYYTGDTLNAQLRVNGVASIFIRVMGLGGSGGPIVLDSGTVNGGAVYNMEPTTIGAGGQLGVRILVLEALVGETYRELARCSFNYGGARPPTRTPTPTATRCFEGQCTTPTPTATATSTATPTSTPTPTPSPSPTPTRTPSPTPRPLGCLTVTDVRLLCSTGQPQSYQLQVQFMNSGSTTINHLFLHPLGQGVTLGQSYFGGLNLPPGQGIGLIPITLNSGAAPGTTLCVRLVARDMKFNSCCVQTVCFKVPCCPQCWAQEGVHVGWDRRFCKNKDTIIIPATICNYTGTPHLYTITDLQTLPVGSHGMCNFDPGYLGFTVLDPPVYIMPGHCRTVRVEITRPYGLNTPMQMACYSLTVTNQDTGSTFSTDGSLLGPGNLWCVDNQGPPNPGGTGNPGGSSGGGSTPVPGPTPGGGGGTWPMAAGQEREVAFTVTNTGDTAAQLTYAVTAVRSDMQGPNTSVSLNGLPAGTDVNGRLPLAAGATANITVTVRVAPRPAGEPFDFHDILLMSDLDGNGEKEPLDSIGVVRAGPTYIYLPKESK